MINLFLIAYVALILVAVFGFLAIVYHLLRFRLENGVALLSLTIFSVGFLFLIFSSFYLAAKIPWGNYLIIF